MTRSEHVLSYYNIAANEPRADRLVYNGRDPRALVTRRPPSFSASRINLSDDRPFVS